MNTRTVITEDRYRFEQVLNRLMFEDGFFVNEALSHVGDYARIIFKKATPTACVRVEQALLRTEKEIML